MRWTTKSPLPSPFTGGGGLKGRKGETSFPLKITFSQCRSRVKESFYENRSIYLLFWGNCLVEMKKLAVRHLWRNWPNSSSDCRSQAGKEERMVFGKKNIFPLQREMVLNRQVRNWEYLFLLSASPLGEQSLYCQLLSPLSCIAAQNHHLNFCIM